MLGALLAISVLALLTPALHRAVKTKLNWLLALLPAAMGVYFATYLPQILRGETVSEHISWLPGLGLDLHFRLDGLSLLFVLLITGIGSLVLVYAGAYLRHHSDLPRFNLILQLFMLAMLGLVLSDNFLCLFVFWELTSITSYLLIGFDHEKPAARQAALQGLLVTVGGGLVLLLGLLLLGQAAGTSTFSELPAAQELLAASPLLSAAICCIAIGAFTKSAQTPFHFWLPNAMAAPTPVSAYLHSATMVKAGLFLLARLSPTLGEHPLWIGLLCGAGALTLLTGAVLAYGATALKKVLAYSTIMALGTLTFLLGLGTELALKTFVVFLLGHALYKGSLFMLAGVLDHQTGSKDLLQLSGLRHAMPITTVLMALAAFSLAGLPLSLGFIGKELLFESVLAQAAPMLRWGLTALLLTAAALTTAVAGVLALRPFLGELKSPKPPREASWELLFAPAVLAALGMVLGCWPAALEALLGSAASALSGTELNLKLKLWHGFNLPLLCSALSLGLGAGLFWLWAPSRQGLANAMAQLGNLGPSAFYALSLKAMTTTAAWQTRWLQNGKIGNYLLIMILTPLVLCGYTLWSQSALQLAFSVTGVRFYEWGLLLLLGVSALYAVLTHSRLSAVASMGILGFVVSLFFMLFSAPDLGITQVLVESLMVILLVLVLFRLPSFLHTSSRWIHLRDASVALSAGVLLTLLVLAVQAYESFPSISDFYLKSAYTEAQGRNIVNVILVDFRALDTLGEIFVLAMAALGVLAMLKLRSSPAATDSPVASDPNASQRVLIQPTKSLILQTAAQMLLPLQLLFSIFLLLRGHDEPGGGFIAGLVVSGAFILYLFAYGAAATRQVLRFDPRDLMAWGLLLALLSTVPGLWRGQGLLSTQWWTLQLRPDLAVKLSTLLIFEAGVYLVVLGSLLTIVLGLVDTEPDAHAAESANQPEEALKWKA